MKEVSEFVSVLRQLLATDLASPLFLAEVLKVEGNTVDLQPLDEGPVVRQARLQSVVKEPALGLLPIPAQKSIVLALFLDKTRTTAFVLLAFELAEVRLVVGNSSIEITDNAITFNQGLKGGLVVVEELVKKLNALEDRLNSHQHQYINAAGTPTPTTALPGVVPLPNTTATELANPDITQ